MRSSNPVMTTLTTAERERQQGQWHEPRNDARPMTVDDVVTKTGITLAIIVVAAAVNFFVYLQNPGLGMILTGVGAIGGFITVLISAFSKSFGSAGATLTYAVLEGLFVGGFSFVIAGLAGPQWGQLIGQAVIGTIGVFLGMLAVYKFGAIRVTPRFTKFLTGALVGVAVLVLVNMLLAIFAGINVLRDGGGLAIVFSLVCIVLGALSFLQDFDVADRLIRAQADSKEAWGVALGLAVTLVWLYTEILRLLSYFTRDE